MEVSKFDADVDGVEVELEVDVEAVSLGRAASLGFRV